MYSFGKLKKTGDCAMYPVPFYDLQGWGLRSMAGGQAIYAAAGDDQAITWGQGSNSMASLDQTNCFVEQPQGRINYQNTICSKTALECH